MDVKKYFGKWIFLAAVLMLIFFVPFSPASSAAAGAGMIPFGGRILVANYCTCSFNWGIKI